MNGHQLQVGGEFAKRSDVVVWIGEQVLDHPALKSHPAREVVEKRLVDALLANPLANHLGFLALVWPFHREVGHDGLFPIFVHHVASDMGRHRTS